MRAVSTALRNLLATGDFEKADCWTITLNGGSVVRWTGADQAFRANGQLFALGPAIKRGAISEKRGVETSTLAMEITAADDDGTGRDLINGQAIIPFIRNKGLDGATVKLERAYAPDWATMIQAGATGTVIRFAGKLTSVEAIQGITASLVWSSWMVLLNTMMPRNLYQSSCLHSLYDSGCGISPAAFDASGTVSGSGQTQTFSTGLSMTTNFYALGRIVFTSGANAGISRTVKSNGSGSISLIQPLPNPLANGDAFTIYAGCDLTQGTCTTKFNNLNNFKATPYIPLPQTPLTTQSTTTTTNSGGKG